MRTLIAAAATVAALATPALAQEKAPFTGPHVDAILGYDRTNPGQNFDAKSEGLLFGGGLGYDFQVGGVVLGVDGEITGSTAKSTRTGVIVAGDSYRTKAGRDLYIGGRIGFAVAPSTLLYVKGGYTNAAINVTYTPPTGAVGESDLHADGYRIGAGIEQKFKLFGPSGFVKAEYRYSNYGSLNSTVSTNSASIDLDRHQAVVGVGVRF